ncbi:DmsC/YnfH family molybdoenzyme membrane anchor subunit [Elioraea sp.]|uniref:dimethyl sulfoxide reductase anchor subunit family protein n=1 Tax=Elioraea sp. TaxID=2185103 RepID=UPI0021DBE57D|nr:DmsC/YnfH family molybdoenzyme membrane anchor subunit [Elioraea sp.]GIX11114.1 MAG: DMSO reductase [Elioraea sp.]
MHPALSVIVFTVASGAGYGLLATLALLAALGAIAPSLPLGLAGFGLALALITGGLLSSTLHLGHPERAWRAFSQWRTSWLSREGVAAVATYLPAGLLALLFTFFAPGRTTLAILGLLAAAGAVATVLCTAMIYRSLKPIHAWCNRWTVPGYLALGAATGLALAFAVLGAFGVPAAGPVGIAAIAALAAAWWVKRAYWSFIDTVPAASTPESATGLGRIGRVRLLDPPHTGSNYLTREMGFRVARKHATRLRAIAMVAGVVLPAALVAVALATTQPLASLAAWLAALLALAGALVERWLFFAEAKHTTMLYYGAASA